MKKNLRNLLCSALLLSAAGGAQAQLGLQDVIVEEYHTITAADAAVYNNSANAGSYELAAGMKVYRVYIDLEPNWRLASVFAIPESPLAIRTTTEFWNDDSWGSEFPAQTRRFDEGALFDSYITINTSGTSGGAAGCGQSSAQFGVRRSVDSNGDLTTCGVYPGFTGTDGHIPAAFPMDPLTLLGSINFQALTGDPAPASEFGFTSSLWGYTGGITGVDPAGSNIVFVGQFTTSGTFSFEINVGLNGPNGEAISYVHTAAAGAVVSAKLKYPQQNDCNGVPGGPAIPGAPCNDNNVCTENDTWNASCQCVGTPALDADGDGLCDIIDPCPLLANVVPGQACNDNNPNTINDVYTVNCVCQGTPAPPDCNGVPGGPAVPGTACNDNNACTINDVFDANCNCAGTFQDTDQDGVCDANDPCPTQANVVPGQSCNDGDPCTINDVVTANCGCAGTFQDTDQDGVCDANDPCPLLANLVPGNACDDNNPSTINDVITAQCVCAGTLQNDCNGVPGGPAQPGTACNDNNACTINDVFDANCNCAGTFQDSDGDGTCDANDGCPNDPNKIAAGACGCGTPDTDSDNDGLADCNDPCPFLANLVPGNACDDGNANTINDVVNANCVCAGTLQNDCNGVPGGPAQPGTACNDNDPCTTGDVFDANCNCAGTFQDSDSDGVCDANDPCPTQANVVPGQSCDDGNPCTINDVVTANCGCAGTFQDTDSDGVCDAQDSCPTVVGQIGSPCSDGNPNTINDQLNAACQCVGVPVGPGCDFNALEIVVVNDAVSIVGYEVRAQGTNALAANGTVSAPGTTTQDICLPNGCYYLVVTDNGGDGITGGGYVLRLADGRRLIDNAGNFLTGSTSQIAAGEGFCLPIGSDRLISTSCDKLDWRTAPCQAEYVVANDNPAVSAQFGITNATSGYELWWFDPNGGYSFKRFQSHSTANGLAASATRACHFRINAWSGNQLQDGVLYNVKVRPRVAGVNGEWGPACRFRIDNALAQCPLTSLNNIPGNAQFSCGVTRGIGSGTFVYAIPTRRRQASNCNSWFNANRYQFRFRIPGEGFELVKTATTYLVNTTGLACGKTYDVDVRASFDGGATWCADGSTWGTVCTLSTTPCAGTGSLNMAIEQAAAPALKMFPNPNRGDQLFLNLEGIDQGVETVSVDIFDSFGKRVSARTIAVSADGFISTTLELNGQLASGLYLVGVTAGEQQFTQRLVIQP